MKCITEIVRRDLTQAARLPLTTHSVTNTKTYNTTCLYIRIFNNNCLTETHSVIDYYMKVSKRVTHLIWLESPFLLNIHKTCCRVSRVMLKKVSETDTATFWCGKHS